MDEFKGYSLFNDIQDEFLRNRNRAVVLANIVDHNTKNRKVTTKAAALVFGYFNQIPNHERNSVKELFVEFLNERGYAIAR